MSEFEHPSLKPKLPEKSASETLASFRTETESLRESLRNLKEQSATIEAEFNSLDALKVLANVESKIDAFLAKYSAVLDKADATLDEEKRFLASLGK